MANVINASRGEKKRDGSSYLSIADILAAFRRRGRLGKIDLCRGRSENARWMGQSTKSISHHPHDIQPSLFFSSSLPLRFFSPPVDGADRYVRSAVLWPTNRYARSVHRGMLMRSWLKHAANDTWTKFLSVVLLGGLKGLSRNMLGSTVFIREPRIVSIA